MAGVSFKFIGWLSGCVAALVLVTFLDRAGGIPDGVLGAGASIAIGFILAAAGMHFGEQLDRGAGL